MTRAPWVSHFGFTKTPFGKSISANHLFARTALNEAVARIRFCIAEAALGVITGDVGIGKTVAVRAATATLDPTSRRVTLPTAQRIPCAAANVPSGPVALARSSMPAGRPV